MFRMFQSALFVLAAHGILGLGMALLPAKALFLRYACVFAVCLSTYKALETFDGLPINIGIGTDHFAMYMVGVSVMSHSGLCILRLASDPAASMRDRISWGLSNAFSSRFDYLIQFDDSTRMSKTMGRELNFVVQKLWTIMWNYCLLHNLGKFRHLIWLFGDDPDIRMASKSLFTSIPPYVVSPNQLLLRALRTLFFFASSYCNLNMIHSLMAIFSVLVLQNSITSWSTPLFGPLSAIHSLRNFWAVFWHNILRKGFTSHAVFIVDRVLGLKTARVRRPAILICAFFCSGLTHAIVEWVDGGCALDLWGSLRLHLRCAGVVFLEDAIGRIYVGTLKRLGYHRNAAWIGRLEKVIGFLWTAGWLMELVPQYEWEAQECFAEQRKRRLAV